ncbi:MAG: molybdopterin-guanine dinucleotide biosynthesis protein MobB [Dehalococcoidia bacterium]|jgi:molybdopterin-guanine dinucleotide biosynthesis protein B
MPPVLCIVGRERDTARQLVEGLVRELAASGVRVAVAVEADRAPAGGYMAAGSEMTIVRAPGILLSMRRLREEPSLDELVWEMRDDYDLVLADGFRNSSYLKLEVRREDAELLCHKNELLAIAGDKPPELDIPAFAVDDFARIADLVRRRFLTHEPGEDAALFIDGVRLPLALFVRKIVAGTVMGMVRPLKGVDDPKSVVITVRRRG